LKKGSSVRKYEARRKRSGESVGLKTPKIAVEERKKLKWLCREQEKDSPPTEEKMRQKGVF